MVAARGVYWYQEATWTPAHVSVQADALAIQLDGGQQVSLEFDRITEIGAAMPSWRGVDASRILGVRHDPGQGDQILTAIRLERTVQHEVLCALGGRLAGRSKAWTRYPASRDGLLLHAAPWRTTNVRLSNQSLFLVSKSESIHTEQLDWRQMAVLHPAHDMSGPSNAPVVQFEAWREGTLIGCDLAMTGPGASLLRKLVNLRIDETADRRLEFKSSELEVMAQIHLGELEMTEIAGAHAWELTQLDAVYDRLLHRQLATVRRVRRDLDLTPLGLLALHRRFGGEA